MEAGPDSKAARDVRTRLWIFLGVFALVAGAGLLYDFGRPEIFRATARLSITHPGMGDDPVAKAQFAVNEAIALRRSEFVAEVARKLGTGGTDDQDAAAFERQLTSAAVPDTNVIELRAEGSDRTRLTEALTAWIGAYLESRKQIDQGDETEALEEARHALKVATAGIERKRREIDAFRVQYGITSIEREENPGAARLKGLHAALNDAATKEVSAEAKLKAIEESIAQGKGYIRAADKGGIAALEMRAVDLREKIKDLEQDFTPQYLAMEPKHRALKANLDRIEQQIEADKQRSQKAALAEAQEEFAGLKRAAARIREQADAAKIDGQGFSMRFVELKRMAADLDQLQEARRLAQERVTKLQSARKPAVVQIRVLTAPTVAQDRVAPDYWRDAGIALGAGLALALGAVWTFDFLRRSRTGRGDTAPQPLIQIAYPMLPAQPGEPEPSRLMNQAPPALIGAPAVASAMELNPDEVARLWGAADAEGRLAVGLILNGVGADELVELKWQDVDLDHGCVSVPGGSARTIEIIGPVRDLLVDQHVGREGDRTRPLLCDATGRALSVRDVDDRLACLAHDAGLRHPEDVTARALHFTYAAFLARQGIRMSDLAVRVGTLSGAFGSDLRRLSPRNGAADLANVLLVYPGLS